MFVKNPDLIEAFWIKAGECFAANWNTNWNGTEECCLQYLHKIPAEPVPACDHVSKDNRKTQAQFECVSCRYKNHADVVGAMNILERGHRLLACGEMVHLGRSKKQEPTEVSQLVFN